MAIQKLVLASKSVALKDLYIFQDNSDADKSWIAKLVKSYKAGAKPEPVLVAELTPTVRRGLAKIRKLHDNPNSPYKDLVTEDLIKTPKPYILLDGNHRYLAGLEVGLKTLPVDGSTKWSAADIATFMHDGAL